MKLKYELTLDETNLIIEALGKHPIVSLIGTMRSQADPQIAAIIKAQTENNKENSPEAPSDV